MNLRGIVAGLVVVLGACGSAPSASAGQSSSEKPFTETAVATFDAPWAMAFLPGSRRADDQYGAGDREGRQALARRCDGWPQARGQRRSAVKVAGQGGLGDVVAHPDFAGNQRIYLSFVEAGPSGTSGAALGYGRMILGRGQPRLDGFKVIWRQQPKVAGDGHSATASHSRRTGRCSSTSGERQEFDPAQDKNVRSRQGASPDRGRASGSAAAYYTHGPPQPTRPRFRARRAAVGNARWGRRAAMRSTLSFRARNYGWPRASYGIALRRARHPR